MVPFDKEFFILKMSSVEKNNTQYDITSAKEDKFFNNKILIFKITISLKVSFPEVEISSQCNHIFFSQISIYIFEIKHKFVFKIQKNVKCIY